MQKAIYAALTLMVAGVGLAPAGAAVLPFTGTQQNQDTPGQPPFRCPVVTVNINPEAGYAFGTSNLGDFEVRQSHCLNALPPQPFTDGIFEWKFDNRGGALTGIYSGVTTLTDTPGVFGIIGEYIITGGRGRFGGATGAFSTEGTLRFIGGRPTAEQSFEGFVEVPGPAAAALLGLGVGGLALRRRG